MNEGSAGFFSVSTVRCATAPSSITTVQEVAFDLEALPTLTSGIDTVLCEGR
jgi:hypothetical protein